ncbi:GntR family transcriptional regulator [Pokkaliibacter sp. MBI-7]|uniref:GntR family transcriptional regulator n=1 Tax=Proteobacteria bacterium 228 TaxID=2083153 RepID=A0A2S5KLM1_9PROT|nr:MULTISPECIES: GntR family transcriptional regulator [Pokkaliibacter]MDH2431488.1 GntR family transcriptional regulator [Pokkaliibacter sp. MBI-7]PPC75721.1 GntR family transcriptional regulator [Pokkaliibacter plantistimulans]
MSTVIDKKLVGQATYDMLRDDIVTGKLKPGAKLKLNELRDRYDVSVNTLREVLMRLVSDGFVLFEDQKGFRVAPISPDELLELAELRISMELLGLRKSMQRVTMDWKSNLVSAHYRLSCMEKLMETDETQFVKEWERADRDFHMTLVANSGSRQLIRYHSSVLELFMRYQVLALSKRPFRGHAAEEEHKVLLNMILEDKVDEACTLLEAHITRGTRQPEDIDYS